MRKWVQLRKGDPGGGTSQGERRALNSQGGHAAERQVCSKPSRRLVLPRAHPSPSPQRADSSPPQIPHPNSWNLRMLP